MPKSEEIYIQIGNAEGSVKYPFTIPPAFWEKWYTVSFQFRQSNGFQISEVKTTSAGMIWVKERWYHRVWNWIYWKIKGSEVTHG